VKSEEEEGKFLKSQNDDIGEWKRRKITTSVAIPIEMYVTMKKRDMNISKAFTMFLADILRERKSGTSCYEENTKLRHENEALKAEITRLKKKVNKLIKVVNR